MANGRGLNVIWTFSGKSASQAGVSLMEMLISLAIFAVVAMPMMMMPLQAVDMSTEARNTSSLNFEIAEFFTDFQHDVNMSYVFMDISQIAANNTSLGLDPRRQVFLAYWDPQQRRTIRKGYQFRPIPGFSDRWEMMEADIQGTDEISDFAMSNNNVWRTTTKTLQGSSFYIKGNPQFVYCKAGACGTDSLNQPITALGADGIRIQNSTTPVNVPIRGLDASTAGGVQLQFAPLQFVYRNVSYSTPIKYFRLATLQQDIARRIAPYQILPFPMALKEWRVSNANGRPRTQQHWIAEKSITLPIGATTRTPLEMGTDLNSAYWELPLRDMHYNRLEENLLVATSSDRTINDDNNRGAYIFKFRPGYIDYRAFTMTPSTGDAYSDPFPVVIHRGQHPAWPASWDRLEFLGVTQDSENNIYVLAKTGTIAPFTYWVQKFSPQGEYLSKFPLGTRVSTTVNSALGIAFNPATPDEVQVFIRNAATGNFEIVSYPSAQNTTDSASVVISATSPNLNAIALGNSLSWDNVQGMEYDALNNRYLFVFTGAGTGTTNYAQLVSLDAELASGFGSNLMDRAQFVLRIYPPNDNNALTGPSGIAYNPANNTVFLATYTGSTNPSRYYTILPDVPLNRPR